MPRADAVYLDTSGLAYQHPTHAAGQAGLRVDRYVLLLYKCCMPKTEAQIKTKVQSSNNLGRLFNALRYAERKSLRDIGGEIGIAPATLLRIESGFVPDGQTVKKLLMWLFEERGVQQ